MGDRAAALRAVQPCARGLTVMGLLVWATACPGRSLVLTWGGRPGGCGERTCSAPLSGGERAKSSYRPVQYEYFIAEQTIHGSRATAPSSTKRERGVIH